jgi:hypothetical protein
MDSVGIGTANPGAPLEVRRAANDSGTILTLGTQNGGGFYLSRSANNGALVVQGDQAGYNNIVLAPSSGSVGIGTTNPQYLLSVKGTVGAEEFIVTNTGWSDYVFQPGYRLQPLSEVNAYIQANHHLPNIPSEAEVKEKGANVGDMQTKLLAKIEELTLHLIQIEARNNRLEQDILELRRQNQQIREKAGELK